MEQQRRQTEANLDHTVKAVGRLEGELAAAARKYTYLQDTRGFIADMCDMLQVLARQTLTAEGDAARRWQQRILELGL